MNKKTVALTETEYINIINTIKQGFKYYDAAADKQRTFRPNKQLSLILQLEANLGLRIGDILKLHIADIVKDGERYRLDITEQKTSKKRTFTVPIEVYNMIMEYALEKGITKNDNIFSIKERAVQKQLKIVCEYLHLENISTHSFRKTYATDIYNNSNYNIELVRKLLQHSSTATTQRYIGIGNKQIEEALQGVTSRYLIG